MSVPSAPANQRSTLPSGSREFLACTLGKDSISKVVTLADEQIKPAPQMGTAINTDYLIDIARLMAADDIGLIEKLAA